LAAHRLKVEESLDDIPPLLRSGRKTSETTDCPLIQDLAAGLDPLQIDFLVGTG